jgi:hypothetical protein
MGIMNRIRRAIARLLRREPTVDESRVLNALAADAISLGQLLQRTPRVKLDAGEAVDLADGDEREILAAALRAGAAQHLRAGEDLLALVERLDRMLGASAGRRDIGRRADLGIVLLRAIAIVELLDEESHDRFPHAAALARVATDAMSALAQGYTRVLGTDVPHDLRRVFPRFARAAPEAGRRGAPSMPPRPAPRPARGGGLVRTAKVSPTERIDAPSTP